jgi:hypothetical protein
MTNVDHFASDCRDHAGRIVTCITFFVPKPAPLKVEAKFIGQRTSTDHTGILGVHVYLPEMHWARRNVQAAIAAW